MPETAPDRVRALRICGLVRKDEATSARKAEHLWLCAETRIGSKHARAELGVIADATCPMAVDPPTPAERAAISTALAATANEEHFLRIPDKMTTLLTSNSLETEHSNSNPLSR